MATLVLRLNVYWKQDIQSSNYKVRIRWYASVIGCHTADIETSTRRRLDSSRAMLHAYHEPLAK